MGTVGRLRQGSLAAMAAAITALTASSALAAGPACVALPVGKVGMQLYSVLPAFRTATPPPAPGAPRPAASPVDPARLEATFAALKAMGWRNIENFGGNWGQGDAGYKAMADRHGLKFVAAHETNMEEGFPEALDRAKALGQKYVGLSTWGGAGLDTLEHVLATAAHVNAMGKMAADRGLVFYLHNHQDEFKNRFSYDINGDGKPEMVTAWEITAAKTDPRYVSFEIDVHWTQMAMGLDKYPELLSFLRAHRNRIVMLHVKDTTPDGRITDLGRGTTEWAKIVEAAGPQIAYYLWEFDNPPNALESARIAHDYLSCGKP